MRKTDVTQHSLYSYRTLEERIPDAHPLRKLRVRVDATLANMNDDFQALYSRRGRPSIAPGAEGQCHVCHEAGVSLHAVSEMGVGLPEPACRSRFQTSPASAEGQASAEGLPS